MILWRISNYDDLKGIGGLKYAGRWHNRGVPVIYTAEHPALALLEVLVHFELSPGEVPATFKLLEIEAPAGDLLATLDTRSLRGDWQEDTDLTRAIGDEWLTTAGSLLLRVPSAVVPKSYNYLLNPRHPAATELAILGVTTHPYDARLLPPQVRHPGRR